MAAAACRGRAEIIAMLEARHTEFVDVPHLTGSILNTDEAILAAFRKHPNPPSDKEALRQARAGGVHYGWAVWDGDRYTGVKSISEHWCNVEVAAMTRRLAEDARNEAQRGARVL